MHEDIGLWVLAVIEGKVPPFYRLAQFTYQESE